MDILNLDIQSALESYHNSFNLNPKVSVFSDNLKIGFTVSKKKINKASGRNKIKRKLRETFRLNKSLLLSKEKQSSETLIMFIYIGDGTTNNRMQIALVSSGFIQGFFKNSTQTTSIKSQRFKFLKIINRWSLWQRDCGSIDCI